MHVLRLPKLRNLDLMQAAPYRASVAAPHAGIISYLSFQPALCMPRCMQKLINLPSAFLAKHGHALGLQVHWESDDEDL